MRKSCCCEWHESTWDLISPNILIFPITGDPPPIIKKCEREFLRRHQKQMRGYFPPYVCYVTPPDRGDCLVQEGVTYSTISSMDAHGLEGPWSFQRDLKIILETKHRKVDPQLPKGLEPQLPTKISDQKIGEILLWNHLGTIWVFKPTTTWFFIHAGGLLIVLTKTYCGGAGNELVSLHIVFLFL